MSRIDFNNPLLNPDTNFNSVFSGREEKRRGIRRKEERGGEEAETQEALICDFQEEREENWTRQ